ncbi:MAG: hypothetical protein U9P68_03765 [Pseudomonadota bacterium]|nr:hypothetical protein [Pseudomonadota bacterium]
MEYPTSKTGAAGWLTAALLLAALLAGPARAVQAAGPRDAGARQDGAISPAIGRAIGALMEEEADGDWPAAASGYSRLLDAGGASAHERAVLLQLLGRSLWEAGDTQGAIDAWRRAIALNALPEDQLNTLRINTGQLLLAQGEYREGVTLIENALARGAAPSAGLAMRLAQGYGQLGEPEPGLGYARQAFALADPPERPHFSILLYFYQQMEMVPEQTALLARMVARWPGEKAYWTSYAALLARSGREADAFEINRILYLNGMLGESAELVRLARYYSYYEYPYGGAVMLERELNAGRVAPEAENYRLLADLWRQAREWDRARPVLHRVATLTGAGPDYENWVRRSTRPAISPRPKPCSNRPCRAAGWRGPAIPGRWSATAGSSRTICSARSTLSSGRWTGRIPARRRRAGWASSSARSRSGATANAWPT